MSDIQPNHLGADHLFEELKIATVLRLDSTIYQHLPSRDKEAIRTWLKHRRIHIHNIQFITTRREPPLTIIHLLIGDPIIFEQVPPFTHCMTELPA